MQINIADEIFKSIPKHKILSAIESAVEHHHSVMIDTTGANYKAWVEDCKNLDSDIEFLVSYALGNSIFVESKRNVVVVSSPDPNFVNQVSFDELTNILLRSFYIYVENGRADKRFLYSILPPELRRDLKKQESNGSLTFENAGGITELAKKIIDDTDARAKLPLRAFALFDSDALEPGVPSKDAENAKSACITSKIPFYCLQKRAIENYIPVDSLLKYANRGNNETSRTQKRIARAFDRLNEKQKSHFHMKEGFKAPHGNLYGSILPADKMTLGTGFGSKLSDCYGDEELINRPALTGSNAWNELETLLTLVMEAI